MRVTKTLKYRGLIWKMQIKTTKGYHCTPNMIAITEGWHYISSTDEQVSNVSEKVKCHGYWRKFRQFIIKLFRYLIYDLDILVLGFSLDQGNKIIICIHVIISIM